MNNSEILGEEAAVRQIVENDFSATNGHFEDDSVIKLKSSAFRNKTNLISANFQNVEDLYGTVFDSCTNLESLVMPNLKRILSGNSFNNTTKLTQAIKFPKLISTTGDGAFRSSKFSKIELPVVNSIGNHTFNSAAASYIDLGGNLDSIMNNTFISNNNLTTIIIRKESVISLPNGVGSFANTKYATTGAGGAYVYVPRDLISSYQTATNWSTLYAAHSDMFRPLEDYTIDGTTTGRIGFVLPTFSFNVTSQSVQISDDNHFQGITSSNSRCGVIQVDNISYTQNMYKTKFFTLNNGDTYSFIAKNIKIEGNTDTANYAKLTVLSSSDGSEGFALRFDIPDMGDSDIEDVTVTGTWTGNSTQFNAIEYLIFRSVHVSFDLELYKNGMQMLSKGE